MHPAVNEQPEPVGVNKRSRGVELRACGAQTCCQLHDCVGGLGLTNGSIDLAGNVPNQIHGSNKLGVLRMLRWRLSFGQSTHVSTSRNQSHCSIDTASTKRNMARSKIRK
jgi:hypothetical protein